MTDPAAPKLSPRLAQVAAAIPPCGTLIDIGTDHALIPIACLLRGVCARAVASDIRQGPLEAAMRNAARYGVTGRIDFIRGDGIGRIPVGNGDCVVIAGMGGLETIRILAESPVREGTLVLQPQRSQPEVRAFLASSGYRIRSEQPVLDRGKYYVVLKAGYTGEIRHPSRAELYIGEELLECILTGRDSGISPELLAGYLAFLRDRAGKERRRMPNVGEIHEMLVRITESEGGAK